MIGVIADPAEHEVVREFFELFKTPWEFYLKDRHCDVLLSTNGRAFETSANLVIVYSGRKTDFDQNHKIQISRQNKKDCVIGNQETRLPIYGETVTFHTTAPSLLAEESSKECAAFQESRDNKSFMRIGYDLFSEIRLLLTAGQPVENAAIPAMELHIALLRNLITRAGVVLVEIPAIPVGSQFIACLTHDVDHPLLRAHKWDHTVVGFIYRAVVDSFLKFIRAQLPARSLLANWAAALMLPFVYLGLGKDFWADFDDRYLALEGDLPSTFFVIPRKGYPGKREDGQAPEFRASRYAARDIAASLQKLIRHGREVGLHGIDAWLDSSSGTEELDEIRRLTGNPEIGVRMHWLYFNQQSPGRLDAAGAAYDSTIGYNETVGYRTGTTQAFKPLGLSQLLELPMHVMDTALFYPSHLHLSPQQATPILRRMVDNVVRHGGVLTINWHDRSLAPERLWEVSYREIIGDMKSRGAWFATASQAAYWFKKRRSAVFETDAGGINSVRVRVRSKTDERIPGLRLRTHQAGNLNKANAGSSSDFRDICIAESIETAGPS